MDRAFSSPRELVVNDDVDVRESRFDFATGTNSVDVLIGYLRRMRESIGAPKLLNAVCGVSIPWWAQ